MRITSAAVKGLFGLFDHEIPLDNPERITIIHGPNGIGKTVMLRMIEALASGNPSFFRQTPFDEFRLGIDDGTTRIIRRTQSGPDQIFLEFFTGDANGAITKVRDTSAADIPASILADIDKFIPSPYFLNDDYWVDPETDATYSLAEMLERFPEAQEALPLKYRIGPFFDASQQLDVFFVEANRLSAQQVGDVKPRSASLVRASNARLQRPTIRYRVKQYSEDI